jgi:molybdopterin-binding protein
MLAFLGEVKSIISGLVNAEGQATIASGEKCAKGGNVPNAKL